MTDILCAPFASVAGATVGFWCRRAVRGGGGGGGGVGGGGPRAGGASYVRPAPAARTRTTSLPRSNHSSSGYILQRSTGI